MGLQTDLGRWSLDEACLMIGRRVERNLNEGKDAFDGLSIGKLGKGSFRSAKGLVKKKMKIPKSGIW
jgi:hypothetical protein